jgi:hypothetical protein
MAQNGPKWPKNGPKWPKMSPLLGYLYTKNFPGPYKSSPKDEISPNLVTLNGNFLLILTALPWLLNIAHENVTRRQFVELIKLTICPAFVGVCSNH